MILITATTRLAREFRRQHDQSQIAAGHSTWPAASVLPYSAWLSQLWQGWLYSGNAIPSPPKLLRLAEERGIWEDIIRSSPAGNELLQIGATAGAAIDAWSLACAWHVPLGAAEWNDTADTEAFRGWVVEFLERTEANNWLSGPQLAGVIIEKIQDGGIEVPGEIELAGFVDFTPEQDLVFRTLKDCGCEIRKRAPVRPDDHASAHRARWLDQDAEVHAAAAWARQILEGLGADHVTGHIPVGFIVPDLAAYRSRIERVFTEAFHPGTQMSPERDAERVFNISLGPALADYPIIEAAFLILGTNPESVPVDAAGRLIRSPFIAGASTERTPRGLLDAALRGLREPVVRADDIRTLATKDDSPHACPELAASLDRWLDALSGIESPQMPSDWAATLARLLNSIGWPGEGTLSGAEYQTALAWRKVLAEFASVDGSSGPVGRHEAIERLRRLAADRQFQPESEPAPIQVLGVFEASGLEFDHLWIMGVHDGAWPGPPRGNPFVPLRLGRQLGMPGSSPAIALDNARLLTAKMLGSSPQVIVSYPGHEGDSELRPSPLFSALPEARADELGIPVHTPYVESLRSGSAIELVEDSQGPALKGERARGGTSIFSHQAACPFRAFAMLRLGAVALDSAEPGLSAIDRGQLVHDALGRVWHELRSHEGLMSATTDRLDAIVSMAVGAAIHDLASKRRALRGPRFAEVEKRRLEQTLRNWLDLEMDRRPFTVVHHEGKRRVTVGGMGIRLRSDRVDRLDDDDTFVVIDYKTGRHSPGEWMGSRPDEPQLPLYATTMDEPVSGVFFATLKTGDFRFRGLAATEGIVPGVKPVNRYPELEDAIEDWKDALHGLGNEFRLGNAEVDPKIPTETCRHCHLGPLCRISESTIVDGEDEEPHSD